MKRIFIATFSFSIVFSLFALSGKLVSRHNTVRAQAETVQAENQTSSRPRCSNRSASGTYGYRMNGAIVGLGSFLVNGYFVHNPDGTMRAHAYGTINGQTDLIDAPGTFTTNDDCTGKGSFLTPTLGTITYFFVLTDGGNQVDLINTNPGIALQGTGRRIAPAGQRPRCDNRMIAGHYSYRLEGSFPGVPNFAGVGYTIHTPTDRENGKLSGFDTNSFSGQIAPRSIQGTYKLNSDCTGSGSYGDSLGNTIDYVFMVVDQGQHIYLQSNYPGGNVAGLATRMP